MVLERKKNMFQNKISKEYDYNDNHDIKDEDLEILKIKEKEFILKERPYEIAHLIALWLKYFGKESTSFESLVNAYSYELFSELTKIKMNQIYNGVERLLREKYKIYIVYRKPLILKSDSLLESV